MLLQPLGTFGRVVVCSQSSPPFITKYWPGEAASDVGKHINKQRAHHGDSAKVPTHGPSPYTKPQNFKTPQTLNQFSRGSGTCSASCSIFHLTLSKSYTHLWSRDLESLLKLIFGGVAGVVHLCCVHFQGPHSTSSTSDCTLRELSIDILGFVTASWPPFSNASGPPPPTHVHYPQKAATQGASCGGLIGFARFSERQGH